MKKKIEFTMPGIREKMVGCYEGCSKRAVVIGVDTAMGFALAHFLRKAGFGVIGLGEAEQAPCAGLADYRKTDYASFDIPEDCNRVLFCHDVASHTERHVPALDALCRELAATRQKNDEVHICIFTPANACECGKQRVREDAPLLPHSLRDLACANAEMTLHAWCMLTHTTILPKIFRYGELYADMPDEMPLAGHVCASLRKVRRHEALESPGFGMQKRSLTHLADFAEMVAGLVKRDFLPTVVNIPGETFSILEYLIPLEDNPTGEMRMSKDCHDDDLPWGISDRVLSAAVFKGELKFAPKHKYKDWAAALPKSAPKLKGFDITKA